MLYCPKNLRIKTEPVSRLEYVDATVYVQFCTYICQRNQTTKTKHRLYRCIYIYPKLFRLNFYAAIPITILEKRNALSTKLLPILFSFFCVHRTKPLSNVSLHFQQNLKQKKYVRVRLDWPFKSNFLVSGNNIYKTSKFSLIFVIHCQKSLDGFRCTCVTEDAIAKLFSLQYVT